MTAWESYAQQVERNEILTCHSVKQVIKKFRDDLANPNYIFAEDKVTKIINYLETIIQFEGEFAEKTFKLTPWQCYMIAHYYGIRDKITGRRKYKYLLLIVGKGNGKTALLSGLAQLALETEKGGEIYTLACNADQSKRVYTNLTEYIKRNNSLNKKAHFVNQNQHIYIPKTGTKFTALSGAPRGKDGKGCSFLIADEIAEYKNSIALDKLVSGAVKRKDYSILMITTAQPGIDNPGYMQYSYGKKVLNEQMKDDNFLPIIYELDTGDEWTNPEILIKANPNLDVSVYKENLLIALEQGKNRSDYAQTYRTKHLNQWVTVNDTNWVKQSDLDLMVSNVKSKSNLLEDYKQYNCVMGLDFSRVNDFTAISLAFELPDKYIYLKHLFFIPESKIYEKFRHDSPMIFEWIKEGLVIPTEGDEINQSNVTEYIDKYLSEYKIKLIAFDENQGNTFKDFIKTKSGVDAVPYKQGAWLDSGIKHYYNLLTSGKIIDDNTVMLWMLSNVKIQSGRNEMWALVKPDRLTQNKRIDGVVTTVMAIQALYEYIKEPEEPDTIPIQNFDLFRYWEDSTN